MATFLKYYSFLRFVSITLVFVNKSLLSGFTKLDAPLFVTFFQCVVTVLACYVLRYVHSDSNQHGFFNIRTYLLYLLTKFLNILFMTFFNCFYFITLVLYQVLFLIDAL